MISLSCVVKTNFKTEYFIKGQREHTRVNVCQGVLLFSEEKQNGQLSILTKIMPEEWLSDNDFRKLQKWRFF